MMPLLRIDVVRGRQQSELRLLTDTLHEAMVEAFGVPARDRYQIVTEHDHDRMIIQDTGLNIARTDDVVVVQMFTRPRTRDQKQNFYRLAAERLFSVCGLAPSDLVMSCSVNGDEDWSFGHGRAQFLTQEL